jgi:hypothetical protein
VGLTHAKVDVVIGVGDAIKIGAETKQSKVRKRNNRKIYADAKLPCMKLVCVQEKSKVASGGCVAEELNAIRFGALKKCCRRSQNNFDIVLICERRRSEYEKSEDMAREVLHTPPLSVGGLFRSGKKKAGFRRRFS